MQKVLIIYGTTEGQTRKIAQYLADESGKFGYSAALHDAATGLGDIDPSRFDRIIVAASIHMDRHQTTVEHLIRQHLSAFQNVRSAFLSVSLNAAGDAEERYAAWANVRQFLSDIGWQPAETQIVGGALRFTEQDFFKRWIMRRIAKEKGALRDTDRDYEYTDWEALSQFLKAFLTPAVQHK